MRMEGYTPAAPAVHPAAHLRRALGIIPSANKTHNSLLLDSLLSDTPSLCTVQHMQQKKHVLGDSFFFFESPPPSLPVCVGAWGWGDGECWAMQLFRPRSTGTKFLPLHFGAFQGASKIV